MIGGESHGLNGEELDETRNCAALHWGQVEASISEHTMCVTIRPISFPVVDHGITRQS